MKKNMGSQEFDTIFKQWVKGETINYEDLIILLMEYNKVFGKGNLTPEHIAVFLTHPVVQGNLYTVALNALEMLGKHYGYEWTTVKGKDNNILYRFINENNNEVSDE